MTLSNLQILRALDPTQNSFDLKNQNLETTKKRSCRRNFFSYMVHILSFTLVSKNSKLETVSKHAFEAIQSIMQQISNEEKELFIGTIIVIKANGGSSCKEEKTQTIPPKFSSSSSIVKSLLSQSQKVDDPLFIPDSISKEFDGKKLLALADDIIKNPNHSTVALKAIAEALSPDLIADQQGQPVESFHDCELLRWKTLLPFFDQEQQVRLITAFLYDPSSTGLLEIIASLETGLWEMASKNVVLVDHAKAYHKLPIPLFASVLAGQKDNEIFCGTFFDADPKSYLETQPLNRQLEFIANIKLEVFEHFFSQERIMEMGDTSFTQLLKVLSIHPDQEHAQKILEVLTLSLFKNSFSLLGSYSFFKFLMQHCAPEQLKKLPIEQYDNPAIRMWLASVTGQLDDTIFKENAPLLGLDDSWNLLSNIHQCHIPEEESIFADLLKRVKKETMFNLAEGFYESMTLPKALFWELRSWLQTLDSLPPSLAKVTQEIPSWQKY